jgi:hypothetical protein
MNEIHDCTRTIGAVTTEQTSVVVSITEYTAGDVVGGLIELSIPSPGGGGKITDIYLTDAANQSEPYTIYIYDEKPTVIADHAVWATAQVIADLGKLIRKVDLAAGNYTTINSLGWAHIPNVDQDFEASNGKLYMYFVPTATPDYAATTDITISATMLLN